MMTRTAKRRATVAALLIATLAASPASAEPGKRVFATTVESSGTRTGCVGYRPEVLRDRKYHTLRFDFRNDCDRDIFVRIGTQFDNAGGGWGQLVRLKPAETLAGPNRAGNWIAIDGYRRRQRFVVMQAEIAHRDDWPSLAGCSPLPNRNRRSPCPPMIWIDRP